MEGKGPAAAPTVSKVSEWSVCVCCEQGGEDIEVLHSLPRAIEELKLAIVKSVLGLASESVKGPYITYCISSFSLMHSIF